MTAVIPVNGSGMSRLSDQLRGKILRSATQGEGSHTRCQPLGKSKVCHLQVAIAVQQQVLRLQISARVADTVNPIQSSYG